MFTPQEKERIDFINDLIEQAIDEMLAAEKSNMLMHVVDAVQKTNSQIVLKECVRTIRKNLSSDNLKVIVLSLNLVGVLVENCSKALHREVGTDRFMQQMVKLYENYSSKQDRDSLDISSRVLELIQTWGETFLPFSNELPLFTQTYHSIQCKGAPFLKQHGNTKAPILSSPIAHTESAIAETNSEFKRLSIEELERLVENLVEMLEDMLHFSDGGPEGELIKEIAAQSRRVEPELVTRIKTMEFEDDEESVHRLMSLNESLQIVLAQYDSFKNKSPRVDLMTASVSERSGFDSEGKRIVKELIAAEIPISSRADTSDLKKSQITSKTSKIPILNPPPRDNLFVKVLQKPVVTHSSRQPTDTFLDSTGPADIKSIYHEMGDSNECESKDPFDDFVSRRASFHSL